MNASKPIDISKSSLISLKAELSRKQQEVSVSKGINSGSYTCPIINPNKKVINEKLKKKVEEKVKENEIETEEDVEALKHSKDILEIKSKLYEKLQDGQLVADSTRGAEYLVNFAKKTADKDNDTNDSTNQTSATVEKTADKDDDDDDNVDYDSEPPSDPEDDWVDFVDVLGRSRRCLRRDLPEMRLKGDKLADSLEPPAPPTVHEEQDLSAGQPSRKEQHVPEVPEGNVFLERLRKKWEEDELKMQNKPDIHYQDLLFDEARTHGVGYFSFSTDVEERARQQQELDQRRKETLRHQEEAKGLRTRRNQQLQARLSGARARNRLRLGLPPEEEQQSDDVAEVKLSEDESCKDDEAKTKELELQLKRAAHVRPWDVGKDGVKTVNVMSQEEWVEKNREERISEFAPPELYKEDRVGDEEPLREKQATLYFTSKKRLVQQERQQQFSEKEKQQGQPTRSRTQPVVKMKTHDSDSDCDEEVESKRRRAEIPPPATAEYFGTASTSRKHHKRVNNDLDQSITEGLKFLRKQQECKDKKNEKGLLDII